jgi:hypothetical protein
VRRTLAEVATVASRTKGTSLASQYPCIAARRGNGWAALVLGHSVLVAFYHLLTRHAPYRDWGADSFDVRQLDQVQRRLVHRLEPLGYAVSLEALTKSS